ncbi:hypothetical protein BDQ12DRAFT_737610 [Crucibulum laeve]|uniref:DUF6534 domain-containing protein n=1 Tax=Crucibulum laeve TaxID=68775 RepID=A0A5C3M2N6_9AGAR|nr:hypothetical protein BDQ12DRAFT_737610 [Crucibulum laeve]
MNSDMDPSWEGIDMTGVLGPLYWGTVASLILSGITIVQAYMYFPSKDRLLVQATAAMMILLDLISTGLVAEGIYSYVIPNFGSIVPLNSLTPVLAGECGIGACIVLLSQLYFVWQIYIVTSKGSMKYLIPGVVIFFAVIGFVTGIGCAVVMVKEKHHILMNRSRMFNIFAGLTKSCAAVADILATAALCFHLGSSRNGIKATDNMLKYLIQLVIQRGLLVAIIQTVVVVLFFGTESRLYWIAVHVNVTRLYANTFFAMLNGRNHLKKRNTFVTMNSITFAESGAIGSKHTRFMSSTHPDNDQNLDESKNVAIVNIDKTVTVSDI